MDLARPAPLPPAPLSRSTSSQGTTLVQQLAGLNETIGGSHIIKQLPGGIPSLEVTPDTLLSSAYYLRDHLGFDLLSSVSGVDMIDHLEVVYHLRSIAHQWLLQVKVALPPGTTEIDSLIGVWIGANWLERETFDLFGIFFNGHPDLRRILLDDGFEGFPLRKDFRPTPLTVHDSATTQSDPHRAMAGDQQRGLGSQRATPNLFSQGTQERLHPGMPTFGHAQTHGKHFSPTTWKHTLERATEAERDEKKKS
jgi:NADH/F420H2 dehydrogenase subunit C